MGSCVPEEAPDASSRFHRVVYGTITDLRGY